MNREHFAHREHDGWSRVANNHARPIERVHLSALEIHDPNWAGWRFDQCFRMDAPAATPNELVPRRLEQRSQCGRDLCVHHSAFVSG